VRTAEAAKTGSVEKYKTSHHFDGPLRTEWLGLVPGERAWDVMGRSAAPFALPS